MSGAGIVMVMVNTAVDVLFAPYFSVCRPFCRQILCSDFVHKTFQVLLLQNQHSHARWD
jgi:hypothetical protein